MNCDEDGAKERKGPASRIPLLGWDRRISSQRTRLLNRRSTRNERGAMRKELNIRARQETKSDEDEG